MMAVFCLRLACGLIGSLFLLEPTQINPRFFRTHFLVALGLTAGATIFLGDVANGWLWALLAATMVLAFVGSIIWLLEKAPGARGFMVLVFLGLVGSLWLTTTGLGPVSTERSPWLFADDLVSAALLGSTLTAMLMGHSYLIAPTMALTPLWRLMFFLGVCLLVRMILAGAGLWLWTGQASASNLEAEMVLWLAGRWLVGFVGPAVLGWMAWETAKIRATQSATGILYVVVILCFLGELLSLLLLAKTGFIL